MPLKREKKGPLKKSTVSNRPDKAGSQVLTKLAPSCLYLNSKDERENERERRGGGKVTPGHAYLSNKCVPVNIYIYL